jgi:hypothetical protein
MKCEMLGKYIASQAEVKTSVFLSRAFWSELAYIPDIRR